MESTENDLHSQGAVSEPLDYSFQKLEKIEGTLGFGQS